MSRNVPAKRRATEEFPSIVSNRAACPPRRTEPIVDVFRRRALVLFGAAFFLAGLGGIAAGCGGAAKESAEPTTSVTSLSGAEDDLSRAEASLDAMLGGTPLAGAQGGTTAEPAAPEEPRGAKPPPPPGSMGLATGSTCESACDALASMRRAAERICALEESRCAAARERVTRAAERVRTRCTECEE
ncbi:MAG: hypothetical protein HOW73_38730 [Polyangiaceae bacterium]|nr:hypothetical protein [Polyangiaceae bacterium]